MNNSGVGLDFNIGDRYVLQQMFMNNTLHILVIKIHYVGTH